MKLFISTWPDGWMIFKSPRQYKKYEELRRKRSTPKAPNYVISFAEKLLKIGGSSVSIPKEESPLLKPLMKVGRGFRSFTVTVRRMEEHSCHTEVLKIWKAHPETLHVVTGKVLVGGCWISHSWCVNFSKRKIIDPTGRGTRYFGWVIDHKYMAEYIKAHKV